jgi:hypothetical protein
MRSSKSLRSETGAQGAFPTILSVLSTPIPTLRGANVSRMLSTRPMATRTRGTKACQRRMKWTEMPHTLELMMYLLHLRLLPLELWIQMSTTSEPCRQHAVNNNATVSTVTDGIGMFTQLCLDLNKKVNDPNALFVKFKAACAESANVDNGTYVHDAFTSITTHHLHDLLFVGGCVVLSWVPWWVEWL